MKKKDKFPALMKFIAHKDRAINKKEKKNEYPGNIEDSIRTYNRNLIDPCDYLQPQIRNIMCNIFKRQEEI